MPTQGKASRCSPWSFVVGLPISSVLYEFREKVKDQTTLETFAPFCSQSVCDLGNGNTGLHTAKLLCDGAPESETNESSASAPRSRVLPPFCRSVREFDLSDFKPERLRRRRLVLLGRASRLQKLHLALRQATHGEGQRYRQTSRGQRAARVPSAGSSLQHNYSTQQQRGKEMPWIRALAVHLVRPRGASFHF
jgi:hypothetical protein